MVPMKTEQISRASSRFSQVTRTNYVLSEGPLLLLLSLAGQTFLLSSVLIGLLVHCSHNEYTEKFLCQLSVLSSLDSVLAHLSIDVALVIVHYEHEHGERERLDVAAGLGKLVRGE